MRIASVVNWTIGLFVIGLVGHPALSQVDDSKEAALAAVKNLGDQPSFGWTTSTAMAEAQGPDDRRAGTVTGWTERGGLTRVALPVASGQEFVVRGGKAAVLFEGNWQTLDQATARSGIGAGPFGFSRRLVTDFKPPGPQAEEYIAKSVSFTQQGDVVTAELNPPTVNELLTSGPRRRGAGPIKDAKGSVIFRITNGVLAGFTVKLSGSREKYGR